MASKKIAILSGKGGTGKTLISVNLAAAEGNSYYVDCDVEEPNGHLFFKPQIIKKKNIFVKIPNINNTLCNGCRDCVNFCKFNALAYGKQVIVFEEVCHSCGGCMLVCPTQAITEKDKLIGVIEEGISGKVNTITGIMNTGEVSGVPIIKELLSIIKNAIGLIFIDCPPGSACVVMESVKDADYCILVTEPSVFGAHNLDMVYQLVSLFGKKCGVVLNKCEAGYNPSEDFCTKNNIEILAKIPFDKNLCSLNSNGKVAVRENYVNKDLFYSLLNKVKENIK
ncbi:MAG: ATP-binding protein [Clostridia bacterium]